jgi:hypothetical protein
MMPSKETRVSNKGGLKHLGDFLRLRPYENKYGLCKAGYLRADQCSIKASSHQTDHHNTNFNKTVVNGI